MSCRIEYAVRNGMLRAVVSGKTRADEASWIARSIAEHAGEETVSRVLIDVRRLRDRVGSLGALAMAECEPGAVSGYRVAVIDETRHDRYYALHEAVARDRGYALRRFSDAAAATDWLLAPA